MSPTLQIERLVDEQKLGRFNAALLAWSFLAMLSDGYDIAALASAAPDLARAWSVAPQDFGPALSASLFGILFGAPLFGYVGDRWGRRAAVIAGTAVFGLGTLATIWTTSITQVTVLRFLTGIGIGGLMPNLIALNSELQPRRWRATMVVLMFTGITVGSGLPGTIQAWLIPQYGWRIMFLLGGVVPLLIAVVLYFMLPESAKYLSLHPGRRRQLLATLRRMRPDLEIADDVRITHAPAPPASGSGLAQIFSGGLAFITPLLWTCFATTLMAHYFLVSWLPLIFETHGLTPRQAGLATSLYHYGGTIGGVLVSFVLGRLGFTAIAFMFLCAVPAIAAIGLPETSWVFMASMSALAGFFVLGTQFGNNAASGLLYPTAVRSRGVGWAFGIGRFGSIVGPLLGASLIAMDLPLQELFMIAALPMCVGLLAAAGVARLCYLRLGGFQLDETPADERATAYLDDRLTTK